MTWKVSCKESGMKVLDFLRATFPEFSGKKIKNLLDRGACQINGHIERFGSTILGEGDTVQFAFRETVPEEPLDRVLFEDNDLFVYNKPAGMTSENLERQLKYTLTHRLDKDTTGVIILVKNAKTYDALIEQFRERQVQKEYMTIVDGNPKQRQGKIENYLGKKKEYHGQTIYGATDAQHGKIAITSWVCMEQLKAAALLLCQPKTGRTHQIRVHMAEMGHPILGDAQYGRTFTCHYKSNRCLLHAAAISFTHPRSGKLMKVQAPLPADFENALHELRR